MNLFNNPSLTDLSIMIAQNANYHDNYNVIVNHDGEVLIELSSEESKIALRKCKFYFSGLSGKLHIGILAARNLRYLNQLYKNLLYCWENELQGKMDYDEISAIQTINYWLEVRSIPVNYDNSTIASPYFKHISPRETSATI